jgi:hypothetical protein
MVKASQGEGVSLSPRPQAYIIQVSTDLMKMPHSKCPFCASENLQNEFDKKKCLDCLAEYKIDERSECIFANTDSLSLPLKVRGTVCSNCGLLQDVETDKCRLCGTPISCDQRWPTNSKR